MPNDRLYDTVPQLNGRSVIPATTPERVCRNLSKLLEKCSLPPPFKPGKHPRMLPWGPQMAELETALPAITYAVVQTVPLPRREKPIFLRSENEGSLHTDVYQQDFISVIEFQTHAATQEEAGELLWWLVDQLYTYQQLIADWGSQHMRYSESRPDMLVTLPNQKFPMRAVRYWMTTSRIYRIPRSILSSVTIAVEDTGSLQAEDELVVKGEDALSHPYVAMIVSVTDEDNTVTYTPTYNLGTQTFQWAPNSLQPADGTQYRVIYLYYGEAVTDTVEAIPE